MQLLWRLGKGTVNDIIALMPDPKPKYTTVATFIKILESKEFVCHEQSGKSFVYYPAIEKDGRAPRNHRPREKSIAHNITSRK